MQNHFFISSVDGALHDTRDPDWNKLALRANYSRTHRHINSLADVKATLRAGRFAWPGGYPMYFITSDGGVLSFESARAEFRNVAWDWLSDANTGWRVIGCDINYEDPELTCDHSGESIECAYGD